MLPRVGGALLRLWGEKAVPKPHGGFLAQVVAQEKVQLKVISHATRNATHVMTTGCIRRDRKGRARNNFRRWSRRSDNKRLQ